MKKLSYEEAKAYKELHEVKLKSMSDDLNSFPKGSLGMVIEGVRQSDEYKKAKHMFDAQFKLMQNINKWFLKEYKKEYQAERKAKQKAIMSD